MKKYYNIIVLMLMFLAFLVPASATKVPYAECYTIGNITCGAVYQNVYNQIYIWGPAILSVIIGLIFIGVFLTHKSG